MKKLNGTLEDLPVSSHPSSSVPPSSSRIQPPTTAAESSHGPVRWLLDQLSQFTERWSTHAGDHELSAEVQPPNCSPWACWKRLSHLSKRGHEPHGSRTEVLPQMGPRAPHCDA